jgi:hypothetical protein
LYAQTFFTFGTALVTLYNISSYVDGER